MTFETRIEEIELDRPSLLQFIPDHLCASLSHFRDKVGGEIAWYYSYSFAHLLFYMSMLCVCIVVYSVQSPHSWRWTAGQLQGTQAFETWMIGCFVLMVFSISFPFLYLVWVRWMIQSGLAEVHLEGGYAHTNVQSVDMIERRFDVTSSMRRWGYLKSTLCFVGLFGLDIGINFMILLVFMDALGSTLSFSMVTFLVFLFNFLWMMICPLSTRWEYHTSVGRQNSSIFVKTFLFENGSTILVLWARRNLSNGSDIQFSDAPTLQTCIMDEFVLDLLQMLVMQFFVAPCLEVAFLKIQRPLFRKLAERFRWITEGMKDPSFECPPLYSKMLFRLFLAMTLFVLCPVTIVLSLAGLFFIHMLDRYKLLSGLRIVRDQLNNHYAGMLVFGWFLVLAESWFLSPHGMWRNLAGEYNTCLRPCSAFFVDNTIPYQTIEGTLNQTFIPLYCNTNTWRFHDTNSSLFLRHLLLSPMSTQ